VWRLLELLLARALRPLLADGRRTLPLPCSWGAMLGRALAIAAIGLGVLAVLSLPVWSLASTWRFPDALPDCCTLAAWARAVPDLWLPLRDSLTIAIAATALSLAAAIAWLQLERDIGRRLRRNGRALAFLPLVVSDVAFLMGVQV